MDHRLEDSGVDPALGLLVDGLPRREVVWHHAPRGSGSHYPAQGIEDLAQVVDALRGVFAEQREVGGDERPLFVAHVGRVRLSVRHGGMLPSRPRKFITRSSSREAGLPLFTQLNCLERPSEKGLSDVNSLL